jgi:trk system potassium uptake protein TrkH
MARLDSGLTPARRSAPGKTRPRLSHTGRVALRIVSGLALLVAAGTGLLWLPASGAERQLTLEEALFTAVSALATTGLTVITPGRDLSSFGQIILLGLMQVGGIGFMVGAVVVFRLMGRRITLEERLNLRDALGAISADAVLSLTGRVIAGVLLIEGVGALLLWLNWLGRFAPGRAAYYAVFHAVSAFTNSSFDLFSGAPDAPSAFPTDTATLVLLAAQVILGGLGIPVIADLTRRASGRRLSLHTRLTLSAAGALLALGTVALFVGESQPGALFAHLPWPRRLLLSFFHSAAARTSGFSLQPLDAMIPANVLVLTVLMFIGGAPASMAGGVTTSTLVVLMLAMWTYARGRSKIVAGGRTIPGETVSKGVAILTVASVIVLGVTWLLLLTQPTTLEEALFEAVSAFATAGFTLGLTPRLDTFGRVLIALTMFLGRLGALTVVVALARREPGPPVVYPEEQVLIG